MQSHDGEGRSDPKAYTLTVVGAISTILVIVSVVGLEALYYNVADAEYDRKVYRQESESLTALRAQQLENLAGYRWADDQRRSVRLPVSRAMELLVNEGRTHGPLSPPPGADSPGSGGDAGEGAREPSPTASDAGSASEATESTGGL